MSYVADVGISILTLIILAVSLNLLLGFAGQFSQAHAVFYGIGAYTAALTMINADVPLVIAVICGIAAAFVFAWFIAIPAVKRVQGEFIILLTIAFQMVVNQLFVTLKFTGGAYGLMGIPPIELGGKLSYPQYVFWLYAVFAVIVVLICSRVGNSPFGRLLKGIREDEEAVRSLGKKTTSKKLITFGFSAAIAGFIGGINAAYLQFIAPTQYNLDYSIFIIAAIVLGGMGNIKGSVVGAIIIGLIEPLLNQIPNIGHNAFAWQHAVFGIMLVVLMFVRPQGLIPEKFKPGRRTLEALMSTKDKTEEEFLRSVLKVGVEDKMKAPDAAVGESVVSVSGVCKRFGGIQAVQNISFDLQHNKITALIGPNGAGKTTIFRLMVGTHKPDTGTVKLYGRNITGKEPEQVAQDGMVRSFQDVRLFKQLSVLENIAMAIPKQKGESLVSLFIDPKRSNNIEVEIQKKAIDYLRIVGMQDKALKVVNNLSFGETKLVAIARLLATECDVLLLDEPMSGVDPSAVDDMLAVIKRLKDVGKTVCIIEHSLHVVEKLADYVIFLESGKVVAEGSLQELQSQNKLVQSYFGV